MRIIVDIPFGTFNDVVSKAVKNCEEAHHTRLFCGLKSHWQEPGYHCGVDTAVLYDLSQEQYFTVKGVLLRNSVPEDRIIE